MVDGFEMPHENESLFITSEREKKGSQSCIVIINHASACTLVMYRLGFSGSH